MKYSTPAVRAWFAGCPSEHAAHALYDVVFGLGSSRHVGIAHDDPEAIPTRRGWWDAPAVEVSRTLTETGRSPSPGRPATIARDEGARRLLREQQLAQVAQQRVAAAELAEGGVHDRVLTERETVVLLALLDRALGARVPMRARLRAAGSAHGVRLELHPVAGTSTVTTERGVLHLDGVRLTVEQLGASR